RIVFAHRRLALQTLAICPIAPYHSRLASYTNVCGAQRTVLSNLSALVLPGALYSDFSYEAVSMDAMQKARILVVDDNRDAAESLQMLLQLIGHEVKVAYDGPQAIDVFTAE